MTAWCDSKPSYFRKGKVASKPTTNQNNPMAYEERDIEPATEMYDLRSDNERIETLVVEGPQSLPNIKPDTRRLVPELNRVHFTKHARGVATGGVTPVWYLEDIHSPEQVVRAFFEENPQLTDIVQKTLYVKLKGNKQELADAFKRIAYSLGVETREHNTGGDRMEASECPFDGCNETVKMLPPHIANHH